MSSERDRLLGILGEGVQQSNNPQLIRSFDVADRVVPEALKDPSKLKFKPGHIKLSGDGIFYTMQSEGVNMGQPADFMRLHVCNLQCAWCDTPYTWNKKMEEFWTESKDVPVNTIVDMIKETWKAPDALQKRLVVSGGEPLLQQKEVLKVVKSLGRDWHVEFETAGTIAPLDELIAEGVQFNCSPKLSSSMNARKARIRPDVIKKFKEADTYFKFVVMSTEDVDEAERDFIIPMELPINRIIMMPQGVTADEVRANARKVVEYTRDKGYRLLGRLQTEIWGAKRGV